MQFFVRFEGKSHVLSSPTVETIDELFLAVEARVEIAMLLVRFSNGDLAAGINGHKTESTAIDFGRGPTPECRLRRKFSA